ncbi:MAG: hypothetical protein ABIH20_04605 [Candidatus Diapherotrites archaeon]
MLEIDFGSKSAGILVVMTAISKNQSLIEDLVTIISGLFGIATASVLGWLLFQARETLSSYLPEIIIIILFILSLFGLVLGLAVPTFIAMIIIVSILRKLGIMTDAGYALGYIKKIKNSLELGVYDKQMNELPRKKISLGKDVFVKSENLAEGMGLSITNGSNEIDLGSFFGKSNVFTTLRRKRPDKALAKFLGAELKSNFDS